jgi:hypothetical protein
MADQKGGNLKPPDKGKTALVPSLRVSRLVAILLVILDIRSHGYRELLLQLAAPGVRTSEQSKAVRRRR